MEENKNMENEVIETTEEVIEEAEVLEEATEEAIAEEVTEETEACEVAEEVAVEEPKKSKVGVIVAIVVAVVIVAAALITSTMEFNKYNKQYVDITGETIQDMLDESGMTLEEFLQANSLPEDMPADTTLTAAQYYIPTGKVAEAKGVDFQILKAVYGLGDDVTAETPWGEAEGKIRVGQYIGEENLEKFKAEYGLGDEVTADTLWGEIRNTVSEKYNEIRKEQEKEAANEVPAEEPVEEVAEEVPAEGEEAPVEEAPAEEAAAEATPEE